MSGRGEGNMSGRGGRGGERRGERGRVERYMGEGWRYKALWI